MVTATDGDCLMCDGTTICIGCGQPCTSARCTAGVVAADG